MNGRFTVAADQGKLATVARALGERGMRVEIADSAERAREIVLAELPEGASVFTAVSATLNEAGIADAVDRSTLFKSVRAELQGLDPLSMEARRLGAAPDVVIGSVQAITSEGRIVVVSATGSQITPYASGAGKVIWVVGAQKVVPDLEAALERVDQHCLPIESERCLAAYGRPSRINKTLIVDAEYPGRTLVVLVREPVGV